VSACGSSDPAIVVGVSGTPRADPWLHTCTWKWGFRAGNPPQQATMGSSAELSKGSIDTSITGRKYFPT